MTLPTGTTGPSESSGPTESTESADLTEPDGAAPKGPSTAAADPDVPPHPDSPDDTRAVTGKRRIAFACWADEERLPGLLVLLRSLALSNPGVCEDFVVLHPGLTEASLDAARRLHPRIVPRRAQGRLDVFRLRGYDTVIALEADMVVLADIGELLRMRRGVGAVPQLVPEVPGEPKERRKVLDDGLLVIQGAWLGDEAQARNDAQPTPWGGSLDVVLEGDLEPIDARYDFLSYRLYDNAPVPDHVAILRFTGRLGRLGHPDSSGCEGYEPAERVRSRYELTDEAFYATYCTLPGAKHPELLLHCGLPLLEGPRATEADPTREADQAREAGQAHTVVPAPTVDRVNLSREVAEVYRAQSRYQEAVDALDVVATDADRPRCHLTLGTCLTALSRYDEAETHLLLATAAPATAPRAFGQLARLAWVRGADDAAHAYARQGLDADPTDRTCHTLYHRTLPGPDRPEWPGWAGAGQPEPHDSGKATAPAAPAAEPRDVPREAAPAVEPRNSSGAAAPAVEPGEQFAHVALFSEGQENAGDKVLPEAVRMCLDADTGPRRWHSVHVHRLFDEPALERLNARRGVVVGGGGLFLPDTSPNGNSGWQWNVPDGMLARITVPLAVFAVGYNVFDGQVYQRQRFARSLRALVERSAFFGLRNHGSVERVRALLPAELRDRVLYQPCPTTVARQLVPEWSDPAQRDDTVLINCAYDRSGLRFGHDYGHFLAQMAVAVRALREHADVRYAAHMPSDERFVHDLRREHGITLPVEPLYDASNAQVLDVYRRTKLVIGMRGHAGMIPFGCGTPIISLISHPKMAYFLSDIERSEWGVSVHDRDLGSVLTERAVGLLADHASAVADVHGRQEGLWRVTRENIAQLRGIFA